MFTFFLAKGREVTYYGNRKPNRDNSDRGYESDGGRRLVEEQRRDLERQKRELEEERRRLMKIKRENERKKSEGKGKARKEEEEERNPLEDLKPLNIDPWNNDQYTPKNSRRKKKERRDRVLNDAEFEERWKRKEKKFRDHR